MKNVKIAIGIILYAVLAFSLGFRLGTLVAHPEGARSVQGFVQEGTLRTPSPYNGNFSRESVKPVRKHTKNAVRIAILDTGFDQKELEHYNVVLCPESYDAVDQKEQIGKDEIGHGTAMALIAAGFAAGSDYCIIGIKVLTPIPMSFDQALAAVVLGLKKAGDYKADVVSMSFGGKNYVIEEQEALQKLNAQGVVLFTAAGNDRVNLDEACVYYPACYKLPLLITVGAQNEEGQKAQYSNYGTKVSVWLPGEVNGLRGTSVSTAIAAGQYAKFLATRRAEKRAKFGYRPKSAKEK
jgi:subtilisin family serine protease